MNDKTTQSDYDKALQIFKDKEKAFNEASAVLAGFAVQQFKDALKSASEAYDRMDVDTRNALMNDPANETALSKMGIPPATTVTKKGKKGTRAKKVPNSALVAYLATERSEADIMAFYKMTEARCTSRLNSLKKKTTVDFREVGGVKMWKALPTAQK